MQHDHSNLRQMDTPDDLRELFEQLDHDKSYSASELPDALREHLESTVGGRLNTVGNCGSCATSTGSKGRLVCNGYSCACFQC